MSFLLGIPISDLENNMLHSDLQRYVAYSNRKMLPFQRLEILIARLSAYIVACNSIVKKKIDTKDFILPDDFSHETRPKDVNRVLKQTFGDCYFPKIPRVKK